MKKLTLSLVALCSVVAMATSCCGDCKKAEVAPDFEISLGTAPMTSKFTNGDDNKWSVWGASMVKGEDNLYHIFYSRWPKELGWSWVVDSEIAHATSKTPYGPWEFSDITLPRRGKEHWDGWCTHNPTIHKFDGKYYLYYMGNTGDGEIVGVPGKHLLNWQHRNNQRIGVAVADSPFGPWKRFDEPLIDISEDDSKLDCLMTSNPSMCQTKDGKYLFIYKSVGKEYKLPSGGPVVHMAATADRPEGPITKTYTLVFKHEGERFPAEDPYIWYQDGKYRAIVKRIKASDKSRLFSLVQYDSEDGINWEKAKYHHVSDLEVTWEDGYHQKLQHFERPQVYMENGEPKVLLCAADTVDANNVRHCWNMQVPINIKRHAPEVETEKK